MFLGCTHIMSKIAAQFIRSKQLEESVGNSGDLYR